MRSRPRGDEIEPASIDYARSRKVAPYTDSQQLRDQFKDVNYLLKDTGTFFFTAEHASEGPQTASADFRTHSIGEIVKLAAENLLAAPRVQVAMFRAGSHEPAELIDFELADTSDATLKHFDDVVASRRAQVGGELQVELRFSFQLTGRLPEE